MGLLGDIAGFPEKFGGRLRAAGEYVGERAFRPAGTQALRGLEEYNARVVQPHAFLIKMMVEHPETMWDEEATRRRMREKGIRGDFGPFGSSFFQRAFTADKEQQEAIARDLSTLPPGMRIPLEIGADPLTYAFMAGPVLKGIRAAGPVAKAAGLGAGVRAGAGTTARQPIFQSIAAAAAGAPVGEQVGPMVGLSPEMGAMIGALTGAAAPFGPPTVRGIQRLRARPPTGMEPPVGMDITPAGGPRVPGGGLSVPQRIQRIHNRLARDWDLERLGPEVLGPEDVSPIAKQRVIAEFGDDPTITLYRGIGPGERPPTWGKRVAGEIGESWSTEPERAAHYARGGRIYRVDVKASELANPVGAPDPVGIRATKAGDEFVLPLEIQRRATIVPGVEPPVGLDTDPVTGIQASMEQVPTNPGAAATRLSTLDETVPNLTELAQTIISEQARETTILSSRLARPLRFVTNRFWGTANTAKAEALDSRVALEAAKFETFGAGADATAVFVDDQARALGFVKQLDDEVIRLKSGQQTTMGELMERAEKFKLSPEESAFVDFAHSSRKSLHDWGIRQLEGHFMAEGMSAREASARAAEIIRTRALEAGERHWPRMPASVAGEDVPLQHPNFFRVGAKAPNLQLPRSAEATGAVIKNSGDPGAVLSRYAQQVFYKVQQETVIKPLLKRFGIDPKRLIPTEMQAAVDGFRVQKDWLKRAQGLLNRARGLSAAQLRQQVSKLSAADVPDDWKGIISRLEVEVVTSPELARTTRVATGEAARAFEPSRPVARLGKAAEATIKAQRAERGAGALRGQIPIARDELKALAAEAAENYNEATRQLKAVQRVLQRGEGLRRLPEHKFPGITELFERSQAEAIEQAFDRLNPQATPRFLAAINNWVGIGVGVQAGTADIGHVSLQMLQAWSLNPMALPGMLVRMTNNKAYLAQMTRFQTKTFRDGTPMFEAFLKHDGRLISEPLMPDVMTIRAGTVTGKVAKFVTNWPVNRSFTRGINLARMAWWERAVQLVEKFKGRALLPDEYRAVMRTGNTITGDLNWTRLGIGQTQRALERIGLRFAPSWLRAMLRMTVTAAYPSLGIEQNLARLALGTTIGTSVLIYTLVGQAVGQKPNLNPLDIGKFMTYRVKDPVTGSDVRIGPGGVLVQLIRTAAKAALLADKALTADTAEEREAAARDLVDIREGKNPLRQMWRAGAPVIGGLIYDMTAGKGRHTYTGRPLSATPEGVLGFGESALPFAVQPSLAMIPGYPAAQRSEGVAGLLSTVIGGRSFPTSPSEMFIEMADEKAQEAGFRAWEEVPKATRADIMRKSPELQAAQDEREKFFEKFPSQQSREDFVYEEIDKSRTLTEDTLLAMWSGVEAGNRDPAEFRRAFSDLMGKHAYHASRLMDGMDTDMKRRKGEVLQDYYARLYHAIQPESFDGTVVAGDFPDGTISPAEWKAWRERRDGFWSEFAEARQFRSYIETEYPTRNWNSPEMAELHQTKIRMNQGYQELLEIPKYRGLSAEAGDFIDSIRGLADRKSRELRFALTQQGIDLEKLGISIPAKLAWRLALEDIMGMGLAPEQVEWVKIAILMDLKPDARQAMLSPERARYLLDNRELATWYPSAYGDAGLGDREIALLGLAEAPMGTSVPERLAAAVA